MPDFETIVDKKWLWDFLGMFQSIRPTSIVNMVFQLYTFNLRTFDLKTFNLKTSMKIAI